MTDYTDELRAFWSLPTLEQARDERVTSPPNPAAYNDATQDAVLDEMLRGLPCGPDSLVLDYGCGIGRVSRALLRRGAQVVAVDVSPEMLAYCREYCAWPVATVLSDGWGCSGVRSASVGGAICLYCLQHCPSLEMTQAILKDLRRVLKPGGWCVCQCTDHGVDTPDGAFIGARITHERLNELLWQAGFADVETRLEGNQTIATVRKP